MEEAEQEKVLRPEIKSANIVYRDRDGDARGINLRQKEADKLYTELSTGIIKGASVFETVAYFKEDDEDGGNARIIKRPVFINMMHVETILFDIEEEDEE